MQQNIILLLQSFFANIDNGQKLFYKHMLNITAESDGSVKNEKMGR